MTNIQWHFEGDPDPLVGTGATKWEKTLTYGAATLGAVIFVILWVTDALAWTWWQYGLGLLIGSDIAGGVVANATNSCKRFYHTPPGKGDPGWLRLIKTGIVFDALHVYPILIGLLFDDVPAMNGVLWYAILVLSVILVRSVPLYLRRPLSLMLVAVAIVMNLYALPLSLSWAWLMPLLFLKIVYGHSVQEEPYRPVSEGINE